MNVCEHCLRALEGCPDEDYDMIFCPEYIVEQEVMLSIKPHWAHLIETGEKSVEVRKSMPKLFNQHCPFRVYLYVTRHEYSLVQILRDGDENYGETYHGKPAYITTYKHLDWQRATQMVCGECVCDHVYPLFKQPFTGQWNMEETCLTQKQLENYSCGKQLYGWSLRDVKIYKEPKRIEEFGLKRPPQSWCYVKGR